jgi:hypothetical protein
VIDAAPIKARFEALEPVLDERERRLFAASESRAAGHGGVVAVRYPTAKQLLINADCGGNYLAIIQLIASTTTETGLTVACQLDPNAYEIGTTLSPQCGQTDDAVIRAPRPLAPHGQSVLRNATRSDFS